MVQNICSKNVDSETVIAIFFILLNDDVKIETVVTIFLYTYYRLNFAYFLFKLCIIFYLLGKKLFLLKFESLVNWLTRFVYYILFFITQLDVIIPNRFNLSERFEIFSELTLTLRLVRIE